MTQLLLEELARARPADFDIKHVSTSVSRRLDERERLRWYKVISVLQQMGAAVMHAARGFDVYYPISQTRIGLTRDIALLLPYRLARRRIVVHLHGGGLDRVFPQLPRALRLATRTILSSRATGGIVLTKSLRPCLRHLVAPGRVYVVANAVEAPPLSHDARSSEGPLRVLYLSSLMANKGYRELVGAVRSLADRGVPVELDIAGGPFTSQDREWMAGHADHESIRINGYLEGEAKWEALAQAHVLALPSVAPEGQPVAILEGMAAGCAIMSTDWGGIRETVGPDAGIVLSRLRGNALQAAIEDALEPWAWGIDDAIAAGAAGRARAETAFTPARFLDSWLAAMRKVRERRPEVLAESPAVQFTGPSEAPASEWVGK